MVQKFTRKGAALIAAAAVISFAFIPSAAHAAGGPIDLGDADTFAVLGASEVTFAGAGGDAEKTTVSGDVGVSPGTSITGQNNLILTAGTVYDPPSVADDAQADLLTAYNTAAGLTPTATGLGNLTGQSLVPGVYSGDLSLDGALTLAGNEDSYWVFQASSDLIIGSGADITMTGGANGCNVFCR